MSHLIVDLEESVSAGRRERSRETLKRVTDLFLRDADALSDEQIDLFDVVIARLANAIETRARAELADRLADAANAPRGVIRSLAHDEIVVARPVLTRSERLSDEDLVAVALAKGRDHMLAISERAVLTEPVTDILVNRGDRVVVHAVAGNPGARFSDVSIATLVDRSRADEALQILLNQRIDLPETHLRQLMAIAKETARRRIAENMPGMAQGFVSHAVERSASRVEAAVVPGRRDYSTALDTVNRLAAEGPLRETHLAEFAGEGRLEETICTLAILVNLTIPAVERLFDATETDLILIIGKAQGWSWSTVRGLIALRGPDATAAHLIKKASDTYHHLSSTTAQRVLHFLKVREASNKRATDAAASRQIRSKLK